MDELDAKDYSDYLDYLDKCFMKSMGDIRFPRIIDIKVPETERYAKPTKFELIEIQVTDETGKKIPAYIVKG